MLANSNVTPSIRIQLAVALIVVVGIVGVVTITLLCIAWRRYNQRNDSRRRPPESSEEAQIDPWTASGQRFRSEDEDTDEPERR